MNRASQPEILASWGQLARTAGWEPVQAILRAAIVDANEMESVLHGLLRQSDRFLSPLCDPLNATGGLNRWLRYDREEAYSDWLAWVLQQLNSREIVKLLRVEDGPTARFCCQHGFRVEREQCIPGGRLDLVLEFGQREGALIIVEVKTTSAEEADTAKQKGYCEWLYARPTRYKGQPILLAAGAEAHEYEGFAALEWSDLCIELRKMVPSLRKRIGLARAAMIIAFIGAVESNLLHLVTPSEGKHGQSLFYSRTIEHLRVSLRQR